MLLSIPIINGRKLCKNLSILIDKRGIYVYFQLNGYKIFNNAKVTKLKFLYSDGSLTTNNNFCEVNINLNIFNNKLI